MDNKTPHGEGKGCKKLFVEKGICHLSFTEKEEETGKVVLIQVETCRGESLLLELNKKNEIIGLDLIAPGLKACQPIWGHTLEENKDDESK